MQTDPSIFSKKDFIDEDGSVAWNHVEPSIFKVNHLED